MYNALVEWMSNEICELIMKRKKFEEQIRLHIHRLYTFKISVEN